MKKQQKLSYQPEYDFILIGIASRENDYRLSWALNLKFNFSFQRSDDLLINATTVKETQSFSVFHFEDVTAALRFNLISNRCENGFLVEELKNIDFFIQVFGTVNEMQLHKFLDDLKQTEGIITSVLIKPESLQSKQKLLF